MILLVFCVRTVCWLFILSSPQCSATRYYYPYFAKQKPRQGNVELARGVAEIQIIFWRSFYCNKRKIIPSLQNYPHVCGVFVTIFPEGPEQALVVIWFSIWINFILNTCETTFSKFWYTVLYCHLVKNINFFLLWFFFDLWVSWKSFCFF